MCYERLFLSHHLGINHNTRVSPKTVSAAITNLYYQVVGSPTCGTRVIENIGVLSHQTLERNHITFLSQTLDFSGH